MKVTTMEKEWKIAIAESETENKKTETPAHVMFSYSWGMEWKTGYSKVYGVCHRRFPSGLCKCYKVWNNDRKKMEWEKADACKAVK